ncbi:uncharacterized protein IWZ02DRAFT_492980 [Phyllosticta citriasiana]|uniref:uncharacterized protein n=1 Tax=Phyllosticta citriasiana TaxID=595635 RepID=UPI0030FD87E3
MSMGAGMGVGVDVGMGMEVDTTRCDQKPSTLQLEAQGAMFDSSLETRSLKRPTTKEASRRALPLLGILACILTVITAIFTILDAAALSEAHVSFTALAAVTIVLDIFAVSATLAFLIIAWRTEDWQMTVKRWSASIGVSLSFISCALTLATYILTQENIHAIAPSGSGHWRGLMATKFTMWAISTFAQACFYGTALFSSPYPSDSQYARARAVSETTEHGTRTPPSQPTADYELSKPVFRVDSVSAMSYSNSPRSSVCSSVRASLQQAVRPITSRTNLIGRGSSSLRESASFQSERSGRTSAQNDGFESWDTSTVDEQSRETVMQSTISPTKAFSGTRLDPIPGSRPVSPANALDGHFPMSDPASIPELPPTPDLTVATPAFFGSPHNSRPATPTIDSSNIHPLFRADSPVPPPAVTPGTVVVASPLSGQVISRPPTSASRSRANSRSRAMSPSSMVSWDAQSLHSSRSMRSLRSARSPSPPPSHHTAERERGMTPPIPEFVLAERLDRGTSRSSSRERPRRSTLRVSEDAGQE